MSLLPGQILPQSEPIGRLNTDGTVTIDKNWWLLIYNLTQQVLGSQGGLSLNAVVALEQTDSDAADTDATVLRQPISSLQVQIPLESDPIPTQAIQAALLLAMSDNGPADVMGYSAAKVVGFGTPTGQAVVANFPGASATLVQCSETLAQILTVLKANGSIGV